MSEDYRFHEYSGGCQCGAVRFHATELRDNPHICHCRMCQKAVGNLFAALISVEQEHLTWTRGVPSTFRSSEKVDRGFCGHCGTPLFYRYLDGKGPALCIGAFDEPYRIPVLHQMGVEGRHPSMLHLHDIEEMGTTDENDGAEAVAAIKATNHQHPDHDTDHWEVYYG